MIVSASYKTDIPAFYGDWFMRRLDAGFAEVTNPYSGKPFRVGLTRAEVDGFVFWTRNIEPFERHLAEVAARGFPFIVQYTVIGYPRALDRSVIAAERSIAAVHRLAARFGPRAVVWRYDPILFSALTPAAWHRDTFGHLAECLSGAVDEVVVSFAQIYRKTARNMARAAAAHGGFAWGDAPEADKRAMLAELRALAAGNGMALSLCAQRHLLVEGVGDAACVDAKRLADVAGREFGVARRAHRTACGCWASKDIGAYDTCPHGCAYCYAVRTPEAAKRAFAAHDAGAVRLA